MKLTLATIALIAAATAAAAQSPYNTVSAMMTDGYTACATATTMENAIIGATSGSVAAELMLILVAANSAPNGVWTGDVEVAREIVTIDDAEINAAKAACAANINTLN